MQAHRETTTCPRSVYGLLVQAANSTWAMIFLALLAATGATFLAVSDLAPDPMELTTMEVRSAGVMDHWLDRTSPVRDQ